MNASIPRRALALAAALALVHVSGALPALAGSGASLAGRVTGADGTAPRAGVVVHLVEGEGARTFASPPTDARGSFRIESAPSGEYRLLVEAPEGAFLAPGTVTLRDGEAGKPVLLALKRAAEESAAEGPAERAPTPPEEGARRWAKWLIVGVVSLATAFVINEALDEEEASKL